MSALTDLLITPRDLLAVAEGKTVVVPDEHGVLVAIHLDTAPCTVSGTERATVIKPLLQEVADHSHGTAVNGGDGRTLYNLRLR